MFGQGAGRGRVDHRISDGQGKYFKIYYTAK